MGVLAVPKTNGFPNRASRIQHFHDHNKDFGARNASHYEAMADMFLAGHSPPTAIDCTRPQGDYLRFDRTSDYFGVLTNQSIILSFF